MQRIQADPGKTLCLGRQGESGVVQVVFPLEDFLQTCGEGAAALTVIRPGEQEARPAAVIREGDAAVWTVDSAWTAFAGRGLCQLSWYVDDAVAKSRLYPYFIRESLMETAPAPEPYAAWSAQLTAAVETLRTDAAQGKFNGKSAYELAVDNGYAGTEAQWLASLEQVYTAEFQKTTYAQLLEAWNAGKHICLRTWGEREDLRYYAPLYSFEKEYFNFRVVSGAVERHWHLSPKNVWGFTKKNLPRAHAAEHATGGSDPITAASIGAASKTNTEQRLLALEKRVEALEKG